MEEEKTTEQGNIKGDTSSNYRNPPEAYRWKKGQSGNYKRRKSFATLFDKAIKKIAEEEDISKLDVEIALIRKAVTEAKKGNFNFYKDIIDRVHGKPKERIGFGVDGEGIEGVEIKIITKEPTVNETTN